MPEGHLVSAPPLCPPCSAPQGQAESGGMVLVACAGPVRPAAALRDKREARPEGRVLRPGAEEEEEEEGEEFIRIHRIL